MSANFESKNISEDKIQNSLLSDLDNLSECISVAIKDTIISVVPSSTNYKNRVLVPWWSKEISNLRKLVNRARTTKQKYPTTGNIESYRSLRNKYKCTIRKSKQENFSKYCSSAENPWDLFRKLTSRPKNTVAPTLLKSDGSYTKNDRDTCEYLLDKWFPDDDHSEDDPIHTEIRKHVQDYLKKPYESLPKITDAELQTIHKISPLKAPGWDLIRTIVLQNLSLYNRNIIKHLFNLCIKYSHFPNVWKFGIGKCLSKPDKNDESDFKTYRCITLLSVIGKWFEKIIMKRLMWTALQNNSLSKNQFGFIPGRSCEDAICNITLRIEKAFNNNQFVLIIFLDISGAFDCTWHPSILKSFIDKGYQPAYVHLISSYLSDRLVELNLNNSKSLKHLNRSSPQGGGFSPHIWNTDFDDTLDVPTVDPDVLSIVKESTSVEAGAQGYADDSQVAIISDSLHACQLIANDVLQKLQKHSKIKKMSYSAEKTKAVIFAKRKIPFPLDIRFNNKQIDVNESANLLGTTLDSRLSWRPHIENQVTKCERILFLLNKCCKLKWGLNSKSVRLIWSGVIEQILLYGSSAWATCLSKTWLQAKLQSVQRLAAIKIIKGFKCISYEASIVLSGLTPIIARAQEKCLVYASKHPEHFNKDHNFPSHVSVINNLAQQHGIDLFSYEIPNKYPSSIAPSSHIRHNINLLPLQHYPLSQINCINIYTDGSKTPAGTGCAFVLFPPNPLSIYHEQFKLGPDNSVFQAELVAILHSLKYLLSLPSKLITSCSINIFTDSESSLKTIFDNNTDNDIVRDIHKYLQFYSTISNVTMSWCRGHSGIIGNEMADYFARQSVLFPHFNNRYKIPISHLKFKLKQNSQATWLERWQKSPNARNTFDFIPVLPPPKHFVNKEHSHKLTQILTGHCRLNMYLNYIGVIEDPACKCEEYVETVDHYLFYCKLESINRTNTLIKSCFEQGVSFPPPKNLLIDNEYIFNSLCAFLSASSRLDFD